MAPNTNFRRNKTQQPASRKRVNITDNDGWTHVTTSRNNKSKTNRKAKSNNGVTAAATAPRVIHDQLIPAEIPEGLTFEKLKHQFELHKERWQASETWTQIKMKIKHQEEKKKEGGQELPSDARTTRRLGFRNCVCIALGSPSGLLRGGIVDRRSISLYQLAALVTMLEFLGKFFFLVELFLFTFRSIIRPIHGLSQWVLM